MTMNDSTTTPGAAEPDLLDEVAKWVDIVFNVGQLLYQPEADKARALAAAEADVLRWETIEKGLRIVCDRPQRCDNHRCRRRRRCRRLETTASKLAAARAKLAAQQAQSQPLPAVPKPAAPAVTRRAGVRKQERARRSAPL